MVETAPQPDSNTLSGGQPSGGAPAPGNAPSPGDGGGTFGPSTPSPTAPTIPDSAIEQAPTEPSSSSPVPEDQQQELIDRARGKTDESNQTPAEATTSESTEESAQAPEGPPEVYSLKMGEEDLKISESEEQFLREMGLSNEQAQKFADFIKDNILPAYQELQQKAEIERLSSKWNMSQDDVFNRIDKIEQWAKNNVSESLMKENGRTADGLMELFQMMESRQSAPAGPVGAPKAQRDQLVTMMKDQRYVDGDPSFVAQVEQYAGRLASGR